MPKRKRQSSVNPRPSKRQKQAVSNVENYFKQMENRIYELEEKLKKMEEKKKPTEDDREYFNFYVM